MKYIPIITVAVLAAGVTAAGAQTVPATPHAAATPQDASAKTAENPPAGDGLSELAAMTFGCPKAALNAAAREAAKVPSQGTYQFSYFRLITDSHHAAYEVHFKSNYQDEAELKYCVAIYCQQGWDPRTTKTSVSLMSSQRQPAHAQDHGDACQPKTAPVKRQKR
jgi:hypothetical protein